MENNKLLIPQERKRHTLFCFFFFCLYFQNIFCTDMLMALLSQLETSETMESKEQYDQTYSYISQTFLSLDEK